MLSEIQQAWLLFANDDRFSRSQKRELWQRHLEPNKIFAAVGAPRLNRKIRSIISEVEQFAQKNEHHVLSLSDSTYPHLLAQIHDPPWLLYCCGDLALLNAANIAMVGSRRPSTNGKLAARRTADYLAKAGAVIVSGMALGVDALCHTAALDSGYKTIAVLATGVDQVYPARHRGLYKRISEQGLLVSEYLLGQSAFKHHFAERNRIVSGLSYATVIIEAAERSGTLITARAAIEQNRDVCVVPGSMFNQNYQGSNRLIQQGAILLQQPAQVLTSMPEAWLQDLEQNSHPEPRANELSSTQAQAVLSCLQQGVLNIDGIIECSGLTASQVCSMLTVLEVEGLVITSGDGYYTKAE